MACKQCSSNHHHQQENHLASYRIYLPALISLLMLGMGILFNHIGWFAQGWIPLLWYALAYLPVGIPVLKEAIEGIGQGEFFSEFVLMSIATIGAFCIGEYPEGVAVMLFYSIGEIFQDRAVGNAQRDIRKLLDVRPEIATVVYADGTAKVSPKEVEIGAIIEIKAGERVPLDGSMMGTRAFFNTAALTGESVPRTIKQGETVLAGMIATDQVVQVRVEKRYDQSALARILAMVQDATDRKSPVELFIRKFARVYTPIVTGLAVLIVLIPFLYSLAEPAFTFLFSDWLYRSLVFLVISCPCALVISIPLGYFGGIGAASRAGILFKGSNYLDAITKVNTVVFDKTGTLTKGVFEVQRIDTPLPGGEQELLRYVASAELQSNHPIARAIVLHARGKGISIYPPTATTELPGQGLRVMIDNKEVLAGNTRLLQSNRIAFPQELRTISETIVVCAIDGTYAGYLLLADTIKEDAVQAIEELKALHITNIQILSGDKQAIVSNLAARLGVVHAYGNLLPEDKVSHIEQLKSNPHNYIAFVGDGINDAPVLTLSHVGIAMGALGSDAAIETADVVIQNDQPSKIVAAIGIGRATRTVVWQNICLAFAVKLIVLVLGGMGLATLWEAVFADVGVALLAILNAIRIQRKEF